MAFLHVDLDPRKGEDLAAEQAAIIQALEEPPAGVPQPTFVIFSGGGYQALWRLRQPEPLDGTPEQYEPAADHNRRLEAVFPWADACHNVDRLLRLPGTINFPDNRKAAKGRVPTLARLVAHAGEAAYDLTEFDPQPIEGRRQAAAKRPGRDIALDLPDDLPEVDLMSLPLDPYWLALIRVGHDIEDPDRHESRSEWQFSASCEMVRRGVDDGTHLAILLNPEFGISTSVLDKGSRARKYAEKQIRSAREKFEEEQEGLKLAASDVEHSALALSSWAPLEAARHYVARRKNRLLQYDGEWLEYSGGAYVAAEETRIRRELYDLLDRSTVAREKGPPAPVVPNKKKVSDVVDALKAHVHLERRQSNPPCWLDGGGPDPKSVVACENGLLCISERKLLEPSASFFTRNALSLRFDALAQEPSAWLGFLEDLWPEDDESIRALQEIFGYLITADTSQQKIFMLVGPPRSGKGTIARVLQQLVGGENTAAPTLNSLTTDLGLQPLIGKRLALISDMRVGRTSDLTGIAENLLRISGEDLVTANRKHTRAWTGTLQARFLIMTNVVPKLSDAGGALARRFLTLVMTESFVGQEDPGLIERILPELPGILNWAIDGWQRLREQGRFTVSQSSQRAAQDLADLATPVEAFVREQCEMSPRAEVPIDALYKAYRVWCEHENRPATSKMVFGRDLRAAVPTVKDCKRGPKGGQVRFFLGISLARDGEEISAVF